MPVLSRRTLDGVTTLGREIESRALILSIALDDSEWGAGVVGIFRLYQAKALFGTEAHAEWAHRYAVFHRALIVGCGSA